MPEEYRSRRSCLAVPGSSQRFLDKARGLAADEVFLDLEDAVAPAAKEAARRNVIAALNDGGWGGKLVAVRVNDAATRCGQTAGRRAGSRHHGTRRDAGSACERSAGRISKSACTCPSPTGNRRWGVPAATTTASPGSST